MNVAVMAYHIPVLLKQVVESLQIKAGGSYIDCTIGEGGHAKAILDAFSFGGRLLGIDLDPQALKTAETDLRSYGESLVLINDSSNDVRRVARDQGFYPADGILFDLGLSSLQLEGGGRGFTFQGDEPLDMRFDPRQELTAWDVVNSYSQEDLERIIRIYGEDYRARYIARSIVANRPINTSLHLSQVVRRATRRPWSRIHPATRTFQAIRIEVNEEMESLELALRQAVPLLGPGGRLTVISYHSLEDRLVKGFLRRESVEYGNIRLVNKKIISPSLEEVRTNPRSRSARMMVAERM